MFYDWYETEIANHVLKLQMKLKSIVLENDTIFATNRLAA